MSHDDFAHADVVLCPHGPLLLRGEHTVSDEDGANHRTTRPVSAICRCGHTATSPWCDGTHKLLPDKGSSRRKRQP